MSATVTRVFARARVVIEVPLEQPWAASETIASVHDRACRQVREKLEGIFQRCGMSSRIIGEPVIDQVVVRTEDGPSSKDQP